MFCLSAANIFFIKTKLQRSPERWSTNWRVGYGNEYWHKYLKGQSWFFSRDIFFSSVLLTLFSLFYRTTSELTVKGRESCGVSKEEKKEKNVWEKRTFNTPELSWLIGLLHSQKSISDPIMLALSNSLRQDCYRWFRELYQYFLPPLLQSTVDFYILFSLLPIGIILLLIASVSIDLTPFQVWSSRDAYRRRPECSCLRSSLPPLASTWIPDLNNSRSLSLQSLRDTTRTKPANHSHQSLRSEREQDVSTEQISNVSRRAD